MKILTNKKNIKIISLILVVLTIFVTIVPNFVYADAEEDDASFGGKLFRPIFKLFAAVGDLVIKGLQKIFIGAGEIKIENPRETRWG